MITSIVLIALIGTHQFNSVISAAINYEPIKITVNKNFKAHSGQVSPELQGREPGVLKHGANFYFKPQLNLQPSYIPSHIEALISLIQQRHHSCATYQDTSKVVVKKDKLIEVLKPFMYPVSDISKETLSEMALEKESNVNIVKPIIITEEPKPVTPELLVIPEAPVLPPLSLHDISSIIEKEVKKEESLVLKEPTVVEEVKIEEPIIVDVEPKPIISELVVIAEAPVLQPLSFNGIPPIVEKEVKKEESILVEEPTGVFPTIPEIDVRPIEEPIINYVESKPITSELVVIPTAPVLPPLSFNDIPPIVEEEVKIEEPNIVDVEPKPAIQELVAIPEAPVLPSLSLHDISSIIEEVKKEESIIFEEPTGVFPTIPELAVGPITEPITNYFEPNLITSELIVFPEASVLPPLSPNDIHVVEKEMKNEEPIIVDVEPKLSTQKLVVIPEAPVLRPLSLHDISSIIEKEVEKEESKTLEEPTGVFPTSPEIAAGPITESINNYVEPKPMTSELVVIPTAPVLPPLSFNGIPPTVEDKLKESIIPEESGGALPEPTIIEVEPKPITSGLVVIPEAPVLPPLSVNGIPPIVEEESIILEGPTGVFSTIPELAVRPITEPTINYLEPKPVTSELLFIPEVPVLPPLSTNDNHVVEGEVKIEELIIVDVEPKPITSELAVLPEAPVLPSLSYNGIPPVVEEVKIEELIKFDESTGVFPSIPEISSRPFPEPLVVSKIAESFALENNILPVTTEEVKIEIPILLEEEPIEVFQPIAEISLRPTLQESEITDSYVLEEVSQPNPDSFVTVKETLLPTIIPKPSNNLGVFSYVPFFSHLSNRAPKVKKRMIPKPASLERFLLRKHPFRLPVTPFPKFALNRIKSPIMGNKKQFLYPTSYAHDVVEKRIAPNMAFKEKDGPKRVKIYIRSNVPKGPSYL